MAKSMRFYHLVINSWLFVKCLAGYGILVLVCGAGFDIVKRRWLKMP